MSAQDNLHQALLGAFTTKLDNADDVPAAARAFTDILVAFAEVVRGPAPEVAGVELAADDTPALILAELRGLRADLGAGGTAIAVEGSADRALELDVHVSTFFPISGSPEVRFEVVRLRAESHAAAGPLLSVLVPLQLTPTETLTLSALLLGAARRCLPG